MDMNDFDSRFARMGKDFDKEESKGKNASKWGYVGGLVGLVAAGVGGYFVGDALNEYITVLKEAPAALQYAVDAGCATVAGVVGGLALGNIAAAIGYNIKKGD